MEAQVQRSRSKSSKPSKTTAVPGCVSIRKAIRTETIVYSGDLGAGVSALEAKLSQPSEAPRAFAFGTPGLGKTATILKLAAQLKRPFWWVRIDAFAAEIHENGSFNFHQLFVAAAQHKAVLVFDDFDGFLQHRSTPSSTTETKRIVASWLAALDEFQGRVPVIATSSVPSAFDQAVYRRFDTLLYFKRLTDDETRSMLAAHLGGAEVARDVITEAKGLSPAELCELARQASVSPDGVECLRKLISERARSLNVAGLL